MQPKSKKITSIATISLFIISMFLATVQLALAGDPTLTLSPTSGPPGTIVTISGSGFTAGTYRVYFDSDGDARYDSGEPYKTVTVGAPGTFTTTLTVPTVPSGTYYIRADVYPYTPPAIASAPFTVKTLWDQLWDKLLAIESEISAIEDKLDDATRWVSDADLASAVSTITSAISSAQSAIIAEINANEGKIDAVKAVVDSIKTEVIAIEDKLDGWFGTGGTYSETTQVETMGGRVTSTTLVPPVVLSTSGTGVTVEWSTDQAHSGSYSVNMTIQADSGHDDNGGRIVINVWDLNKKLTDIDPSTTLEGQLKHTFWAFQPTPFLTDFPYFRIRLDTDGDPSTCEVMLVAMGTHTLRPEQQLPADAPTGQWIQLTEIGGGEIVDGEYVEGTQYWRPVPYEAFEYHVLQYWQKMYPEARIIDVAVICGFWGTPRTETVSIYIDDINILGYTFNLETEPTVSIAKAVASETSQFTVTLSADVTDVGDIAIVKVTFDGTNWVTLEELTTDGYKTITIAARGVEILYYDASPYNMVIDWGITVIAKPDVAITWTP